ncbi:putative pre RNA processing PIH1 Nop17 [Trypanosoma vivax]|nr:putative pre RNA processing PIH1 Nop17 [Trypanosoma vivax]
MPLETINLLGKKPQEDEKFSPTAEEINTIRKKMEDPKFMELFQEYMKSMEDPETRREEEAYLEQVEREAKEGGDYSFDFVFPKPGFVVELLEPSTTYRVERGKAKSQAPVYVNMGCSDKIDPFREETTGDRGNSNWYVPVSISKPRTELFSEVAASAKTGSSSDGDRKESVIVYDAVFHPNTLQLAERSDRFCCFLVNIAVEHINTGYGDSNGFQFRRLPSSVPSVGTLQNQTITRQKGKSPFEAAKDEPVLTRPTKTLPKLGASNKVSNASTPVVGKHDNVTSATGQSDSNAGNTSKLVQRDSMPRCTVTHRGRIDLCDAWGWKVVDQRVGVPEALVVKMEFVGVQTASVLNVEVEGTYVAVSRSSLHNYHGTLPLPFTVETVPLEAKFERKRSILTLVLRVVPPEPAGITATDMRRLLRAGSGEDRESLVEGGGDVKNLNSSPQEGADSSEMVKDFTAGTTPVNEEVKGDPALECVVPTGDDPKVTQGPSERHELATPQFSGIADQERVRLVMEKLEAARREREKMAKGEAARKEGNKNGSLDVAEVAQGDGVSACTLQADVGDHEGASAMTGATTANLNISGSSATPETQESSKMEELIALQQRQDSWRRGVEERLGAMEKEEQHALLEAQLEARRDAERLRKRVDAAKIQEAAEAKLRECMAELPLRSKHIFTID